MSSSYLQSQPFESNLYLNIPSQNNYFPQFNYPTLQPHHSLHINRNASSPLRSPTNPCIVSEISPQSNFSSQPTSYSDHHYDFKPLYQYQPTFSPDDFLQAYELTESPLEEEEGDEEDEEDLEEKKSFNTINRESDHLPTKQGKKLIFKIIRQENPKMRKRNVWSNEEDAKLLDYIKIHGKKWSKIARLITGRTGKQVRDRYLNVLIPNINREDWIEEEDQKLLRLFASLGAQWCRIADNMKGRTEAQVKNRYYTYLKKMSEGKTVILRPKNKAKKAKEGRRKNVKSHKEKEAKTLEESQEKWLYEDLLSDKEIFESEDSEISEQKVVDIITFEDYNKGRVRGFDVRNSMGFINEEIFL